MAGDWSTFAVVLLVLIGFGVLVWVAQHRKTTSRPGVVWRRDVRASSDAPPPTMPATAPTPSAPEPLSETAPEKVPPPELERAPVTVQDAGSPNGTAPPAGPTEEKGEPDEEQTDPDTEVEPAPAKVWTEWERAAEVKPAAEPEPGAESMAARPETLIEQSGTAPPQPERPEAQHQGESESKPSENDSAEGAAVPEGVADVAMPRDDSAPVEEPTESKQPESEAEPVSEPETDTAPEAGAAQEPRADAVPEAEAEAEPPTDGESKLEEAALDLVPDIAADAAPGPEPKAQAEALPVPKSEAAASAPEEAPEPDADAEPEAALVPGPKAEAEAVSVPKPEAAPEPAAEAAEAEEPVAEPTRPEAEAGAGDGLAAAVPQQSTGDGVEAAPEEDPEVPADTEPEQSLKYLYEIAPEPRQGPDSALAGLDAGQFLFGPDDLPHLGTVGRASMTEAVPMPRPAVEDVEAPDVEASEIEASEPTPPYPGAALAAEDGSAPSEEYRVKAALESKHYYSDDRPGFAEVAAQVWFRTTEEAERAGFTCSDP